MELLSPEQAPERADAIVIGAGLAGLVAAARLAEAGVDVCLLEAREDLPADPDGLGQVETGVLEHVHRTLAALGEARTRVLLAWTDRAKAWLDEAGLLDRCGIPWACVEAREEADVRASAAALAQLGRPHEVWEGARVDAETGGQGFGSALFLPDDGRLAPGTAVRLLERARAAGAAVVGGVRARLVDDPGADGVVAEGGGIRVEAETVLICAGAGSGAVDGSLAGRVVPVREQALRTTPVALRPRRLARAGQGWTTWSQRDDGALWVSGARWASPHLAVGESDPTVRDPRITEKLEGFTRRYLGVPDGLQIVEHRGWLVAQTPDGLPIVGPLPGDPRRVACTGFGPAPTALAVAGALAVVDGLLTGGEEVPWMFSPRRMVRWRNT